MKSRLLLKQEVNRKDNGKAVCTNRIWVATFLSQDDLVSFLAPNSCFFGYSFCGKWDLKGADRRLPSDAHLQKKFPSPSIWFPFLTNVDYFTGVVLLISLYSTTFRAMQTVNTLYKGTCPLFSWFLISELFLALFVTLSLYSRWCLNLSFTSQHLIFIYHVSVTFTLTFQPLYTILHITTPRFHLLHIPSIHTNIVISQNSLHHNISFLFFTSSSHPHSHPLFLTLWPSIEGGGGLFDVCGIYGCFLLYQSIALHLLWASRLGRQLLLALLALNNLGARRGEGWGALMGRKSKGWRSWWWNVNGVGS